MASPSLLAIPPARRFRLAWIVWPVCGVLLYLAVLSFALAWNWIDVPHRPVLDKAGVVLRDGPTRNVSEAAAAVFCIALALLFPKLKWLRRLERPIARIASHRTRAILVAGSIPVIVRLGLLPVFPVPQPRIADEFGRLLVADTFASGKLTNPTHPFWQHFEAVYVFHQPTYTSLYPVAPAVMLAIPIIVGIDPWFGACLECGLMCAVICWMLQGWVPPKWAFLGSLLGVCRFTVVSPWMNSYWGGATAAIGGALVVGSLPRLLRHWRASDSILLALGLAILAQSRPYEGLLLSIPLVGVMLTAMLRQKRIPLRIRLMHGGVPLASVLFALACWTAYYNWRVTGNPLLMPYLHHKQLYGTPQSFAWQRAVLDAPGIHRAKDIADVFQWQLDAYREGFAANARALRLASFWTFYLQPLLTLPLLWLPFGWRGRKMGILLVAVALVLLGNTLYPFFFPHYAAPLCGVILLLVVQGLRRLGAWKLRSRRIGASALPLLLLGVFAASALDLLAGLLKPEYVTVLDTPRAQVLQQLTKAGGKHLVLVRYSQDHSFHDGIVYNNADIDHSAVVWARSLADTSNRALANYYRDRHVWIFNPDDVPVRLVPFTDQPYLSLVAGAAGLPDDLREGVSPGEIAILLGAHFARGITGTTNPRLLALPSLQLVGATAEHGDVFAPVVSGESSGSPGPFPFRVGDVSVQFGNRPAPILAVSNFSGEESLTVQVPFDLPLGLCPVTLRVGGVETRQEVRVVRVTPGIFQVRLSDSRFHGVLQHAGGALVDLKHPARPGEFLRLLTTGIGTLYPPVATNKPGAAAPISQPIYRIILGVNNHAVERFTAEYAPGLVGVDQITFQVPSDLPSGNDIPLLLAVLLGDSKVYSNKSSFPVAGRESGGGRTNLAFGTGDVQ